MLAHAETQTPCVDIKKALLQGVFPEVLDSDVALWTDLSPKKRCRGKMYKFEKFLPL
jgi:hypothetical protein